LDPIYLLKTRHCKIIKLCVIIVYCKTYQTYITWYITIWEGEIATNCLIESRILRCFWIRDWTSFVNSHRVASKNRIEQKKTIRGCVNRTDFLLERQAGTVKSYEIFQRRETEAIIGNLDMHPLAYTWGWRRLYLSYTSGQTPKNSWWFISLFRECKSLSCNV
jgi:hypothetical protein